MFSGILLAIIQAATEFLPISSSGHLAIATNLISQPDLFFFTALHLASLIAVLIFTRKELASLVKFKKETRNLWLFLMIATIPSALFGFFFRSRIEGTFSSFLFIGIALCFTGVILFFTRFTKGGSDLSIKSALIIGLFQTLALFPGVSRSGITISCALFLGIGREKAAKFSFLLFVPLSLGAFMLEGLEGCYVNLALGISFLTCLILSLLFLNLLIFILKRDRFWLFSIYCVLAGLVTLAINYL
ncbi:MAG: undecaprenyl-diphosphate phosphatase [Candidatus Omnitrophota bacterium]